MSVLTGSFEYNGAKVTVQKPNGFSRLKVWRLRQALNGNLNGMEWGDAAHFCYYLGNTLSVEGSLGFPVPCENPTPDELVTFCRALGEAEENLLIRWDNAIQDLMIATNDPDLLPPHELDEKKDNLKKSNSKD